MTLRYRRTGAGPALVLLHSMGGDRSHFDEVAAWLAARHTVIAVDLPGHGETPAPARFDVDEIARALGRLVRDEGAAPAVIVGHSLGGTIAAHVPLVDAAAARALVIVDSGVVAPWSQADLDGLRAALAADREATLRGWFEAICQPAQRARIVGGALALADTTILGYLQAVLDAPVAGGGRALTLPVLLMATRLLLPGKQPRADELAAAGLDHVPDLEVAYFARSLHWVMWDEPDELRATLERFLARVSGGTA